MPGSCQGSSYPSLIIGAEGGGAWKHTDRNEYFTFRDGFCHTPTLNGHSLAPIGQNDPGPFSTALATKTLTSTF